VRRVMVSCMRLPAWWWMRMLRAIENVRKLRILDIDSEARPIAWYGGLFVTKQPTGIGWKWIGERGKVEVRLVGLSDRSSKVFDEERAMLTEFAEQYEQADIVTAHYLRGYDLRTLNAAYLRLGLPLLGPKMSICTKDDLVALSGISKSMENLSAMFELKHQKLHMTTTDWFYANTLQPDGIERTRNRLLADVTEHIELFETLRDAGALKAPRMWQPEGGGGQMYHA